MLPSSFFFFFFFSLRKWEFRRIYNSKLLQIKVQWVSIHSLTPLVVTRASKNSFDHATLSQLSSPGEWCRQTAYSKVYQSEPETVAVSPFDLLNTTLKSLFLSWIFATHFLKPVQRVFLVFFFSPKQRSVMKSTKLFPHQGQIPLACNLLQRKTLTTET